VPGILVKRTPRLLQPGLRVGEVADDLGSGPLRSFLNGVVARLVATRVLVAYLADAGTLQHPGLPVGVAGQVGEDVPA
jgi:hypothetical protein